MRPLASLPGSAVQRFHRSEELLRFGFRLGLAQPQRTEPLVMAKRAPQLLPRIGAENRKNLSSTLLEPAKIYRERRNDYLAPQQSAALDRALGQTQL